MGSLAFRSTIAALVLLSSAATLLAQRDAVKTKQGLKLTLGAPMEPIRPGELVSIPFTIKNMQPKPVLLVVNQGETGGHYAAKTLTHQLVDVVTENVISRSDANRDGCPVGEGLKKTHFYAIAGGKEYRGVVNVLWPKFNRYVPVELANDMYRLEVTYARPKGMPPGQMDDEASRKLWTDADDLRSNRATVSLRIVDWDAESTRKLSDRIAKGEVAAMRVAQLAKLEDAFPAVEKSLFNFDALPGGHHGDFRTHAVEYLATVPFTSSGPALMSVLKSNELDYRLKYHAIYSLASFPPEVVGPWAVEQFGKHDDHMLRDKLLGVLIQRKYATDDKAIIAYMLEGVRSANRDQFSSSTASYMLSACEAIGGQNSRPVVLAIRDRLGDVKSKDQYDRFVQQINALLDEA